MRSWLCSWIRLPLLRCGSWGPLVLWIRQCCWKSNVFILSKYKSFFQINNTTTINQLLLLLRSFIWSFKLYIVKLNKRPTILLGPHTARAHALWLRVLTFLVKYDQFNSSNNTFLIWCPLHFDNITATSK